MWPSPGNSAYPHTASGRPVRARTGLANCGAYRERSPQIGTSRSKGGLVPDPGRRSPKDLKAAIRRGLYQTPGFCQDNFGTLPKRGEVARQTGSAAHHSTVAPMGSRGRLGPCSNLLSAADGRERKGEGGATATTETTRSSPTLPDGQY